MSMELAEAVGHRRGPDHLQSHDGGGELLPAVLAHEIDFAASGVREYTEQIKSGPAAGAGGVRQHPVPNLDAPTLTESGIDVVFANWRGIIAPPGITTAEQDALIDTFSGAGPDPGMAGRADQEWLDRRAPDRREFGAFLAEQDRERRGDPARSRFVTSGRAVSAPRFP